MLRPAAAALLLLLASSAALAEEPPAEAIIRPLEGISVSAGDSGGGTGAQLGIRVSPLLLRATIDFGGGASPRGYIASTVRGDWLYPITEATALLVGIGYGRIGYGFIFDSPVRYVSMLTPEVGVIFGPDRLFGRVVLGLSGFVPLGPVSHEQGISPPHVMATVVLSL